MQVDTAALRLRDSILTSAETEGLTYQAYWLSTTLALGAFLKARPALLRLPHSLLPLATSLASGIGTCIVMLLAARSAHAGVRQHA